MLIKIYRSIIYCICTGHMTNVSVNRKANKTVNVCKALNYLKCHVEIFLLLLLLAVCMYLLTYCTLTHVMVLKGIPLLTPCHHSNIFLISFTYYSN